MSSVLITGGAGFIGSHTCLVFLEKGYEVYVIDSFVNSSKKSLLRVLDIFKKKNKSLKNTIHFYEGDVRDTKILNKIFNDSKNSKKAISGVIHFAGLKSVSESVSIPFRYWDVNVCGTINLLDVMNTYKCFSLIFSSSATVYGCPRSIPINEESLIEPINPYGRTKSTVENLLSDIFASDPNKWRICSLRYFNPVGAHPSGLIGEDPKSSINNLFPILTNVAIGSKSNLDVFGSDWDTKDGSGVRDYIHVMDIEEGHLSAFDFIQNNDPCNIRVNLGSGVGYSVIEIINEFQNSTGQQIPYKVVNRRKGDVPILIADINKSKELFGWSPKRSLKDMCIDSWYWKNNNFNS